MKLEFADQASVDIYESRPTKVALKALPASLHAIARRKLDQMAASERLEDLKIPPGNRLERKKGNLSRFHAIRINDQFRIVFVAKSDAFCEIAIVDYHS